MLGADILNSLILAWMTMMITQGHRVTKKHELVLLFCCEKHKPTQMIMMFDYVREITVYDTPTGDVKTKITCG